MKINSFLDPTYSTDEIGIQIHPKNKSILAELQIQKKYSNPLEVIDPICQRNSMVDSEDIYFIEAMDHLSKVYMKNDKIFYTKGRLKDLENLYTDRIVRINNSVMLNLSTITSFTNGQHARMEVHTTHKQVFIVSQHYAKKIKGELTCSHNSKINFSKLH